MLRHRQRSHSTIEGIQRLRRIKKAKLFYNGKALYYVVFGDTYRWQDVNFADTMANQGDNMIVEILDVCQGTKSPNAAVTEFILQGAH